MTSAWYICSKSIPSKKDLSEFYSISIRQFWLNKENIISWDFQKEFNNGPVCRGVVGFRGVNSRCQGSYWPTAGSPILEGEGEVMEWSKFGKSWNWKPKGRLLNRSCYHRKMPLPGCRQGGRLKEKLQRLSSSHTARQRVEKGFGSREQPAYTVHWTHFQTCSSPNI